MSPRCARCGALLAVPDEPCPGCLFDAVLSLETGESRASGEEAQAETAVLGSRPGTSPDTIGPYRILRTLGEGGMGVVYLAEQREPLRRQVALKLIKLGMDTRGVVARFEAERQALALMDHPHIASVFDAGATEDGRPYFVMEYVAGVPITDYCDKARLSTRERLTLFTRVCSAIQHAHHKGVIHRDIKPSNVLVAVHDGQPTPKVIDFGIAKATERSAVERTLFTQHGQLVGTPEYMSPEQANQSGGDIDATTDIYSLGVVLYELLVGALPFDPVLLRQRGYNEMLRVVCEDEPPRPSTRLSALGATAVEVAAHRHTKIDTLRRELKGDLDWITLRAMEKNRARRYPSASELAADIERYLRLEPIVARRPTVGYRTRKFVRRHRLAVAAASLVAAATLSGLVVSSAMYVRAERARRAADEQRQTAIQSRLEANAQRQRAEAQAGEAVAAQRKADERRKEAEYQMYAANVSAANLAIVNAGFLQRGAERSVRAQLERIPERLRHWEWGFLAFTADPSVQTAQLIRPEPFQDHDFVQTADGRRLLVRSFRHVFAIDTINPSRAVSYAASGRILAIGRHSSALALDGVGPPWTVQFIDLESRRVLHSFLNDGETEPPCAAISADNRRAVVATSAGRFTVWDTVTGRRVASVLASDRDVAACSVGLSPDGSVVLSAGRGVSAWSASTGVSIPIDPPLPLSRAIIGASNDDRPIAFSADGRRAAVGRIDSIAVLDLTSHPIRVQIVPVARGGIALALSSNGARLVVSSALGVSLWSLESAPHRLSEFLHDSQVYSLAFSVDDATIHGLCTDWQLHTWATNYMTATTMLTEALSAAFSALGVSRTAVSPSGRLVASGNREGSLALWRISDGAQIATWRPTDSMTKTAGPATMPSAQGEGSITALSFSADERALAVGYAKGGVGIRNLSSGAEVRRFVAHTAEVRSMATSKEGRWLATGSADGTVRVWDWARGVEMGAFHVRAGDRVSALAFRSDDILIIGAGPPLSSSIRSERTAFLWDWRSRRVLSSVIGQGAPPLDIAISPMDGRIALALNWPGSVSVSLWDSALTREIGRFTVPNGVDSVAFSPDGRRLVASGLTGNGTYIWDAERLDLLATLSLRAQYVRFTSEGRHLVASRPETSGTRILVLDSAAPALRFRRIVLDDRTRPNIGPRAATGAGATGRPDLSGTWMLETRVNQFSPTARELMIAQTATAIEIVERPGGRVFRHRLDGAEVVTREPIAGGVLERVSVASWEGDALVIRVSSNGGERRLRYYLDGSLLAVETVPAPSGEGSRVIYRRIR